MNYSTLLNKLSAIVMQSGHRGNSQAEGGAEEAEPDESLRVAVARTTGRASRTYRCDTTFGKREVEGWSKVFNGAGTSRGWGKWLCTNANWNGL
jgi:hypothetical protein